VATRYQNDQQTQAAACAILNAINLTGNWERFQATFPDVCEMYDRSQAVLTEDGAMIVTVYDPDEEIPVVEEVVVQ
jgi:hypothetical protein